MSSTPSDPEDRIHFVPRHQGPNVFPNFFFFSRLVRLSYKTELLAVKDLTCGYNATYAQLLTDVLNFRNVLRSRLDPSVIAKLDRDEEVFINLLGPGGYEFTVAFLALIALGAVIVTICRYGNVIENALTDTMNSDRSACERSVIFCSQITGRSRGYG